MGSNAPPEQAASPFAPYRAPDRAQAGQTRRHVLHDACVLTEQDLMALANGILETGTVEHPRIRRADVGSSCLGDKTVPVVSA